MSWGCFLTSVLIVFLRETSNIEKLFLNTARKANSQNTDEPRCEKTGLRGFPTRTDTNRSVLPQKIARGLKFRI